MTTHKNTLGEFTPLEREEREVNGRQRLRREDPVRTGPIRNWSTLYRQSDSWETRASSAGQKLADDAVQGGPANDVVTRGVELGYRVVEEHIRQGQRVAQQFNNQSYNLEKMSGDVRELTERIFRDSTDLLSLWFEMVNSLGGNSDFMRNFSRSLRPEAGPQNNENSANGTAPTSTPTNRSTSISLEIVSPKPVQVTLNLYPQSEGLSLMTHGLHSVAPENSPLTNVTFKPGLEGGLPSLSICVPQGQPPALYTGVVVDRDTGLPRGTLSVRITE